MRLLLGELPGNLHHALLELLSFDLLADFANERPRRTCVCFCTSLLTSSITRRDVLLEHRSPVRACLLHAWQAHAAFGVPVVRALSVQAARHVSANPTLACEYTSNVISY